MISLLLWSACIPIDIKDLTDDPGDADGFLVSSVEVVSGDDGTFAVDFDVRNGDAVFQVVAATSDDNKYVATEYLDGPGGNTVLDWNDWLSSPYSLTSAFYVSNYASTLNWPVRAADGPLEPGTYTYYGAAITRGGRYASDVPLEVFLLQRPDDDFSRGTLDAVVAYAGGLEGDAEVVRGMEAGVAYWKEIYGDVGIDLQVEYTTIAIDAALPDTYEGVPEYETLMQEWGSRAVLMVVGDRIADDNQLFGEAGGIPGPYYPQPHGAVEVSWLTHAGGNAVFSDSEIGILGETMAHEVGHYLGLFHPVEYEWEYWDALDDTEECSTTSSCENALSENLMFPYPVCNGRNDCVAQNQLTGEQAGVTHRYVGVE